MKKQDGLGVSNLQHMNTILLMKWWWKIVIAPEKKIFFILREKYGNKYGTWNDRESRA